MQILPPPDPLATDSNRSGWRNARNNRPPLPELDHTDLYRRTRNARHLDEHLPAFAVDGAEDLQAVSLFFAVTLIFHVLNQDWEIVAVIIGFIVVNSLVVFLARRPQISGRLPRLLCGIFFRTQRRTASRQPFRRSLRFGVLFAALGFMALSFTPLAVRHHRPPLVDPRLLSRTGYLDYLREHNFFRDPPPSAPAHPSP